MPFIIKRVKLSIYKSLPKSFDEIEQSFKDSVDDYLAFCKERGEEPDRPFSGKFNLRIPPDLHAKLSIAAQLQGESLNHYITKMLQRFVA